MTPRFELSTTQGRTGLRFPARARRERQRRRDKVTLILLVLLMVLSVLVGMYLMSKGLHPKQLRRRRISDSRISIIQQVTVWPQFTICKSGLLRRVSMPRQPMSGLLIMREAQES